MPRKRLKLAQFEYADPLAIGEALDLLASYPEESKIPAGGPSLVPLMNFRLARSGYLIDTNRIDSLSRRRFNDGCLLIGATTRQSRLFAVQVNGHRLTTAEGMAPSASSLHPLQQAFHECHALQCGFCMPGISMTMGAFLRQEADPTPAHIGQALGGNLYRCTGYQSIVKAVRLAARRLSSQAKC